MSKCNVCPLLIPAGQKSSWNYRIKLHRRHCKHLRASHSFRNVIMKQREPSYNKNDQSRSSMLQSPAFQLRLLFGFSVVSQAYVILQQLVQILKYSFYLESRSAQFSFSCFLPLVPRVSRKLYMGQNLQTGSLLNPHVPPHYLVHLLDKKGRKHNLYAQRYKSRSDSALFNKQKLL